MHCYICIACSAYCCVYKDNTRRKVKLERSIAHRLQKKMKKQNTTPAYAVPGRPPMPDLRQQHKIPSKHHLQHNERSCLPFWQSCAQPSDTVCLCQPRARSVLPFYQQLARPQVVSLNSDASHKTEHHLDEDTPQW